MAIQIKKDSATKYQMSNLNTNILNTIILNITSISPNLNPFISSLHYNYLTQFYVELKYTSAICFHNIGHQFFRGCALFTNSQEFFSFKVTLEKKQSGHMAVCLPSVISHLYAVVDGDTWGRVKVQFGTGLPAGPDKYQFPVSGLTPRRKFTRKHTNAKGTWRIKPLTVD